MKAFFAILFAYFSNQSWIIAIVVDVFTNMTPKPIKCSENLSINENEHLVKLLDK